MAHILIADDNADFLEIQCALLRQQGYEVTAVPDGLQAIQLVESGRFDLLITDLVMPEKEGIDLIIEARGMAPALKILAVSGAGLGRAASYLGMARKLGADATLLKPITGQVLLDEVSRLLSPGAHGTPRIA